MEGNMKKPRALIICFVLVLVSFGSGQAYLDEVRACRFLEQGKIKEAVDLLHRKIKRYPNNFDSQLYLGLAYFLQAEFEQAIKILEKVELETEKLDQSPAAITADRTTANIDQLANRGGFMFSKGKRGILKFALGLLYKNSRDFKNAQKRFSAAIKYKYPENEVRAQLLITYCFLKDYKKAKKELEKIAATEATEASLAFLKGYIGFYTKDYDLAEHCFSQLQETMLPARLNLAAVFYNQGKYQPALDIWLGILEGAPKNAEALKNSGRAYYHLGRTAEGQAQFETLGFKMKVEKYSPKTIALLLSDLFPDPKLDLFCEVK